MFFGWPVSLVGAAAAVVLLGVVPNRRVSVWSEKHQSTGSASLKLVGGGTWFSKWWPIGATWPFLSLEQYPWGIRIGLNFRWVSWYLPTTDLSWSEILVARRTRSTVRFIPRSAPGQWVSFGPIDPRLISVLKDAGVSLE